MNVPTSKSKSSLAALVLLALLANGCVAHTHVVGLGATGTGVASERQFYLLFGLLGLNTVDAQRMAPDLTSYTIETGFELGDLLWSPFLVLFTMTSRTVTVRT